MGADKTVLIVEDEVLVGMMLAKKIGEYGYTICEIITTGEEVLEAVRRHQPGAVLMDISLGEKVSGIEAAREIRKESDVPVIFFTGYNRDNALKAQAEEVGALALLDKLGPVEELVAAVGRAFV